MEIDYKRLTIDKILEMDRNGNLVLNHDYQRGTAWKFDQRRVFIDSVFRKYPIPAIIIEEKEIEEQDGTTTKSLEIIDGQQRIKALRLFRLSKFNLFKPDDNKLRLPFSLRDQAAPWTGKRFDELSEDLKRQFLETEFQVCIVREVSNPDEVRSIFIRLQNGKALHSQEIRDAWPGDLGPKIEGWAGKLKKRPKYKFFSMADGRTTRDIEENAKDEFVKSRVLCAQMCQIMFSRASDPESYPSIRSKDLDELYIQYTNLSHYPGLISDIERIFDRVEEVLKDYNSSQIGGKKVSRMNLLCLGMFIQGVYRSEDLKFTKTAGEILRKGLRYQHPPRSGQKLNGEVIYSHFVEWRDNLPEGILSGLDPVREFSDEVKAVVWKTFSGICAKCGQEVKSDNMRYEHFPVPHHVGGKSDLSNCRLIHDHCYPELSRVILPMC
jgi:hypothetical protein